LKKLLGRITLGYTTHFRVKTLFSKSEWLKCTSLVKESNECKLRLPHLGKLENRKAGEDNLNIKKSIF